MRLKARAIGMRIMHAICTALAPSVMVTAIANASARKTLRVVMHSDLKIPDPPPTRLSLL
jgi:hypothetical protein